MEIIRASGPLIVEPIDGGDEGDRAIIVQVSPHRRVEILLGKDLATNIVAPCLTMTDEELIAKLKGEAESAEAQSKIQLPAGMRPATAPPR